MTYGHNKINYDIIDNINYNKRRQNGNKTGNSRKCKNTKRK